MKRELTGIYLRSQVDGTWGTWDISDLPWETVELWLKGKNNIEYITNCKNILLKSIGKILTFINSESEVNVEYVEKTLYGDELEQCHQCLMLLNLLAGACGNIICNKSSESLSDG